MAYQAFRNKDYFSRDISHRGKCPLFNEEATLSIHLSGKLEGKYDLQPTFTPHIKECHLLKDKDDKNTTCMLFCPVFEKYKTSHEY